MEWLVGPEYWVARLVFQRLLGVVYLVAFVSAFNQFAALAGDRGLLPCRPYLRRVGFRRAPSLFHLHYSSRFARAVAVLGVALSVGVVAGVVERLPLPAAMAVWLALWALYLSFLNAGQTFFGFLWETLLLEAGFLAVFLGSADVAPLLPAVLALRWLLFRLEVGAGLIKLRNDQAWRDLTALYHHHETQPIPNRLSRWFHHLPEPVHRLEAIGTTSPRSSPRSPSFCPSRSPPSPGPSSSSPSSGSWRAATSRGSTCSRSPWRRWRSTTSLSGTSYR